MGKKKQLAKIAHEAIEAYMILIAQIDALGTPMVRAIINPGSLQKEAMDMSDRVEKIMERDV